ncbi:uridine kinase [Brevibacterium sp. UMB10442]|uniref:uridine kinase n=1 Tax=Brevibacterium sp. UMB1308A TaxID=3050608 RepID=UPI0025514019|nr:uridine kinase [Brevibacterium sp. UMB1308A]MDK7750374.1 uridine kinase [Brevibacterium sp. UMB10442]MDK8346086.1 uridine kinase [Brevibacterium sp. UMB1308B]MDK8713089.1 uridine kinase [Brevibacterium sp. UMB1308A]
MPIVIGIAGGTGSGKTTLTQALADKFAGRTTVIYQDNYYKRQDHLTFEERTRVNYDSPDAFDIDLMAEHIEDLKAMRPVQGPVYDFSIHNRTDETVDIQPESVILVEGILLLHEPRLCSLLDIKLFVDADADVRILRRIKRDVLERGRSIESVEKQYLETVKPMHELYVETSKRNADLIIPDGGHNLVALDMLVHRLSREL